MEGIPRRVVARNHYTVSCQSGFDQWDISGDSFPLGFCEAKLLELAPKRLSLGLSDFAQLVAAGHPYAPRPGETGSVSVPLRADGAGADHGVANAQNCLEEVTAVLRGRIGRLLSPGRARDRGINHQANAPRSRHARPPPYDGPPHPGSGSEPPVPPPRSPPANRRMRLLCPSRRGSLLLRQSDRLS